MAEYAQRGQCAVAVPGCHLSSTPFVLWGLAGILLSTLLSTLFSRSRRRYWLCILGWRNHTVWNSTPTTIRPFTCGLCCLFCCLSVTALLSSSTMMSSLKGAVEVDTDSVASNSWVLVSQGENKRGVIAKADPALAYTQAALRLAEENHVWWEWKVLVVL